MQRKYHGSTIIFINIITFCLTRENARVSVLMYSEGVGAVWAKPEQGDDFKFMQADLFSATRGRGAPNRAIICSYKVLMRRLSEYL